MLRPLSPILVVDRFPGERRALLDLLASLQPGDWARPTIASDWTVKDVAAHLVADDLGRLSRQRDGYLEAARHADQPPKDAVDRRNAEWVMAARRLSPAVLRSLLVLGGAESQGLFESLDPFALGPPVSWAGPDPAPVWLDLARELTERWHHQQQIRDAVGAPPLMDPTFLRPVLETFAFALLTPYRDVEAEHGTIVELTVEGPSGGQWAVTRSTSGWALGLGGSEGPRAAIRMGEDTAWRMYVRALPRDEIEQRSRIEGDGRLARHLFDAFALIS